MLSIFFDEGTEQIEEYLFHKHSKAKNEEFLHSTKETILDIEKEKIKSAVFTDIVAIRLIASVGTL
ncbi:MAG: hypothetical protein NTW78_03620 [Campylobacterales bacterium]|nr:hypothetical protein [Campylobacterales bacterium]